MSHVVRWYIRTGCYITLAELFCFGAQACSCHSLYQMYIALPVFVTKKAHSESQSEKAVANRNARRHLRRIETGYFGLPSGPW